MSAKSASDLDHRIAERVKAARKARGLSLTALAELIGITYQQMQKYEAGTNRISAGRLLQIAEAVKHEIAYFFDSPSAVDRPARQIPLSLEETRTLAVLRRLPAHERQAVEHLMATIPVPHAPAG